MGNARWDKQDWEVQAATVRTKTTAEIFTNNAIVNELDPLNIKFRESVDSDNNPLSTPIIISCDVTGSMGMLADNIVREGLGVVMQGIYDRRPVTDPHVCIMATGDTFYDRSPLQVTQFEASIVLADQLKNIYLERGGGGNEGESYSLAWYFAVNKVVADAQRKRGKKGYLFTIGDEPILPVIPKAHIKRFIGDDVQSDVLTTDLYGQVTASWETFHLIVKPVRNAIQSWRDVMGQRAIEVGDPNKLAEVIVSTIQVNEGANLSDVAQSWDSETERLIDNALRDLRKAA